MLAWIHMQEKPDSSPIIAIWVYGAQPPVCARWKQTVNAQSGCEYQFPSMQSAFDASSLLRGAGIRYDLEVSYWGRAPWWNTYRRMFYYPVDLTKGLPCA